MCCFAALTEDTQQEVMECLGGRGHIQPNDSLMRWMCGAHLLRCTIPKENLARVVEKVGEDDVVTLRVGVGKRERATGNRCDQRDADVRARHCACTDGRLSQSGKHFSYLLLVTPRM